MLLKNISKNIKKHQIKNEDMWELVFYLLLSFCLVKLIQYVIKNRKTIENFFNNTKKGIERVDGVVYINLENREDRKKLILDEMELMKIPEDKINKVSGIYMPKNGHKGCVQAHLLALRIAKMNNWSNTLILEDDAKLTCKPDEFQSNLEEMFKYFESNSFTEYLKKNENKNNSNKWDVILLCPTWTKKVDTTNLSVKRLNHGSTSSCYLINNHYLDTLINLFEDCNNKMIPEKWGENNGHEPNALDQRWNDLQKKDNWFTYKDNLITQREVWSSINSRGNKIN